VENELIPTLAELNLEMEEEECPSHVAGQLDVPQPDSPFFPLFSSDEEEGFGGLEYGMGDVEEVEVTGGTFAVTLIEGGSGEPEAAPVQSLITPVTTIHQSPITPVVTSQQPLVSTAAGTTSAPDMATAPEG